MCTRHSSYMRRGNAFPEKKDTGKIMPWSKVTLQFTVLLVYNYASKWVSIRTTTPAMYIQNATNRKIEKKANYYLRQTKNHRVCRCKWRMFMKLSCNSQLPSQISWQFQYGGGGAPFPAPFQCQGSQREITVTDHQQRK